jgi:hypothetical protein
MAAKIRKWIKDIGNGEWGIDDHDKVIVRKDKEGKITDRLPIGPKYTQTDLKVHVKRENERACRRLQHDKPSTIKKRRKR